MQNLHFLQDNLDKPIFHKNIDVFFLTYPYTHVVNTLLVDDIPYKSMFDGSYNVIFMETFDSFHGEDKYLMGIVFPYLKSFHFSRYGVCTFVEHNPFGRIRCINQNDLKQFKMLFVKCNYDCKPTFYNNEKLKLKQKIPY
jgi:hypothetical protein